MNASEVLERPGLQAAKNLLRGLFSGRSQPHAILLFGEEGSGKSDVSEALVRYWMCQAPSPNGACGACRACLANEKGTSADRLDVSPRGLSYGIHVAAIQAVKATPPEYEGIVPVQAFLRTMPIQARAKVVNFESAERMNDSAAHSLLKLLEEPPEYAHFILRTTELSRIKATIRSRCLVVPCELPTEEEWRGAFLDAEAWETVLSRRSAGVIKRIREHREVFREIFAIGEMTVHAAPGRAMALSERFRRAIDLLNKEEESNLRRAAGSALSALGRAMAHAGAGAEKIQRVAESHRRILGNVGASLELDALFSSLLTENERNAEARPGVLA